MRCEPTVMTVPVAGRDIRVHYDAGFEQVATEVGSLAAEVWPDIAGFFNTNPFSFDIYIDDDPPTEATGPDANPAASLCTEPGAGTATSPAYFLPAAYEEGGIHVRAAGGFSPCALRGIMIHELFHQAHYAFTNGCLQCPEAAEGPWNTMGDWLSEGAADWAVELFAPACNLEWSVYPLLLTRCTARPLESLGYDASLFFTYIQQFENEDTVR